MANPPLVLQVLGEKLHFDEENAVMAITASNNHIFKLDS